MRVFLKTSPYLRELNKGYDEFISKVPLLPLLIGGISEKAHSKNSTSNFSPLTETLSDNSG